MSTVAFWPFYELGHIYPTLRLARGLRDAGHRVVYCTIADFEEKIRSFGLETEVVLSETIPRGTIPALHQASGDEYLKLQELINSSTVMSMLDDTVDEHLRSLAPDLLLYDAQHWALAMAARKWQIPCFSVNVILPGWAPGVPPLSRPLPYGDTRERLAASEKAWDEIARQWTHHPFKEEVQRLLGKLYERYGYQESWIEFSLAFQPTMAEVPELVLCPAALDYPRPPEARHFIESIDLEREPMDFPWDRLAGGERLVFCSLGSQAYRVEGARRFFSEVLAAAAARPSWRFVVILGSRLDPEELGDAPGNALLVPYGPQVELLEKSDLVLTHCGLGTIKESLYLGKPMLAFPVNCDQPGNAARLAYHGLAEVGDLRTVTGTEILAMADRILEAPGLPGRLEAMRQALVELEEERPGLAIILEALNRADRERTTP